MNPAQLDHLRRIDAHLANLLATAEKRTPGEWYCHPETLDDGRLFNTINTKESFVLIVCSTAFVHEDAAFIAACAGNAEAGWKTTRLAIKTLLEYTGPLTPQIEREYAKEKLGEIIALFPNV